MLNPRRFFRFHFTLPCPIAFIPSNCNYTCQNKKYILAVSLKMHCRIGIRVSFTRQKPLIIHVKILSIHVVDEFRIENRRTIKRELTYFFVLFVA